MPCYADNWKASAFFTSWRLLHSCLKCTLILIRSSGPEQVCSEGREQRKTVSNIISETCEAKFTVLKENNLSPPGSQKEWLQISEQFMKVWSMPHVVGCIDGKHSRVEFPKLSGTLYYNYKGLFSIVLMTIYNVNYCFTLFDLGQYGSNNNSGVLINSEMGKRFDENLLCVLEDRKLTESHENSLLYFILGDEIFPLKIWLMRPYLGRNASEEEKI